MSFASAINMQTTTHGNDDATFAPEDTSFASEVVAPSEISTQPRFATAKRMLAFGIATVLASPAIGFGIGALTRSRRAGLLAGGATLVTSGLVRWQLQRFFTDEPTYTVERQLGELEIRRYEARVEAHTRFSTLDFDHVREHGFRRLASYIFGANSDEESLAMTVPVTIAPRAASHTMAFTMPPERTLASLPRPDDSRVDLVEVPVRRFAVLRYNGGYRHSVFHKHATRLLELVANAGLTALGEPMFAGFDPPTTLPFLRRTEVWLELA